MGRGSSLSCFHHLSLPQLLCQARATDLQGTHCPLALWAQRPTPEVPTQPRGLSSHTQPHPASRNLPGPPLSSREVQRGKQVHRGVQVCRAGAEQARGPHCLSSGLPACLVGGKGNVF